MKKGFTLIELLIVMVLVGILVTIALPKYRASMERGRATEGITNLKAASDAVNAQYIIDGNQYVTGNLSNTEGDYTKPQYFTTPVLSSSSSSVVEFTTTREGNSYTLTARNENGTLLYITCAGDTEKCQEAGAEQGGNGAFLFDFR